jgi:hypothetical protein
MGFKQRERKRKVKAAAAYAQRQSRQSGSSSAKWWLTPLTSTACCNNSDCRLMLRAGTAAVYRHTPREVLCQPCADRRGIFYRPSLRWVQQRGKRKLRAA